MSDFQNPDGTYNGVKLFSSLSGLSEGEIKWTFDRLKVLMTVEKKDKETAKRIVEEEAKARPWEKL